jgi:hypothetical protein
MTDEIMFKLVIEGYDGPSIEQELGHRALEALACFCEDRVENLMVLSALARHPSSAVRACVASRRNLTDEAVASLIECSDKDVGRELPRSEAFKRCVTTDQLLKLIDSDVGTAVAIAAESDAFDLVNYPLVVDHLVAHPDPAVRMSLIDANQTPRNILNKLLNDVDREVSSAAEKRLSNY